MKKINFRKFLLRAVLCLLTLALLLPTFVASASSEKTDEVGYETYTYWYGFSGQGRKAVYSKPMYETGKVMSLSDLNGIIGSSSFTDIHTAESGKSYLLDAGASRVAVLDESYNVVKQFVSVLDEEGNLYNFKGAKGIFADENGVIYIADTNNRRVLKCTEEGKLIRTYVLPNSNLIPTGFSFKPIKVAVDKKGYVYILSDGSYYGAILYSPTDEFLGFYGSNDVAATFAQALTTLWNRLFVNNTKRGSMMRSLPYTFADLWIDDLGFVYTTTGSTKDMNQKAQVKRLNPGGSNVLNSSNVNFADEGYKTTKLSGERYQNLMGIAVDENGFIYSLDATYGRVFIHDSDCQMITAFGGGLKAGEQNGTFYTPSAISYNRKNGDVLVTDSNRNTLTVFNITDYGRIVKSAQAKTVVGNYEEAMDEWTEVLAQDRNCQLAYAGLAKAYYVKGHAESDKEVSEKYLNKSLDLAEEGYDRETYSLAYGSLRTVWIEDHFTLIMILLVLLVAGVIVLLVFSTKRKIRLIKNEKAHLAATMLTHPIDNFHEIKEKGLTSIPACLIIILLYYVFTVMETTMGGFAFVYFDPSSYNALLILARTAGIVILWTVVNWATCTLFGGKGKMKEIFTVISYSLIPSLFGSIIFVIATNLLVPSEAAFLGILTTICTGYSLIMLAAGSMIMHDYSIGKFIATTLLTLLGCAIVVFLLVVIIILLQQTWGFINTVYFEIIKLF